MTIYALAIGKLKDAPVVSTSRNGNRYTRFTLLIVDGTERK